MKFSTLLTFLSLALAASATASPKKDHKGAHATAANLTLVADPNVNAAASNGAKGDDAAALAQEAVDEFESGQAATATAADAPASANVAKENAAIKKAGERKFRAF